MPGPLHKKLGIPTEIYQTDLINGQHGTSRHLPTLYNTMIRLYDALEEKLEKVESGNPGEEAPPGGENASTGAKQGLGP